MDTAQIADVVAHHNKYLDVLVLLGASTFLVMLLSRLRLSPIVGYMLAGLIIGPGVLGLIRDAGALHSLGELGVACLLFIIGLELSLARLNTLRSIIFGFATFQVVGSIVVLGIILYCLGLSPFAAFIASAALALSSTAVVVQLLSERGELGGRLGRVVFATLLLQDLVAIPLIAMASMGSPPDDLMDLVSAAGKAIIALTVILLVAGFIGKQLLRRVARTRNMELFTAFTLFVVIGMGVATESVGLSMALGTFLAGLLLSGTEYRHKVEADIAPFKGMLLGLFFMNIGMSIDVHMLMEKGVTILLAILALTIIKSAIIYAAARVAGKHHHLSMRLSFYLAGAGEFAFVVIGAGSQIGLFDKELAHMLLAVTGGSLLLTPLLNELDRWVQHRRVPVLPAGLKTLSTAAQEPLPKVKILLAGFGRMGEAIANELRAQDVKFIAVDTDADRVAKAQARGLPVYFGRGDDMALLRQMDIDNMQAVIIALDRQQHITDTVKIIHEEWPHVPVLARAHDHDHAAELQQLGVNVTVVETVAASLALVESALVLAEAIAELQSITGKKPNM